jgi:hypothetical protein
MPLAVVLGHVALGRIFEAQSQWVRATDEYARALEAWDPDYGAEFALNSIIDLPEHRPRAVTKNLQVARPSLAHRVDELTRSQHIAGGRLLERGRWLLAQQRWAGARAAFEQVLSAHPHGDAASEARYLAQVARLQSALEPASGTNATAADAGAMAALESVAREPYDFTVSVAKLARASILSRRDVAGDADRRMRDALEEWHANQHAAKTGPLSTDLSRDVISIRDVVFTMQTRAGTSGQPPVHSYLLFNSDLTVSTSDGGITTIAASAPIPGLERVLFVSAAELALLKDVVVKLAGTSPDGQNRLASWLRTWWKKFFQEGSNAWGGVHIEAYPVIHRIEFIDAGRTRAVARISTNDSEGESVVLQKERGTWTILRVVDRWIA